MKARSTAFAVAAATAITIGVLAGATGRAAAHDTDARLTTFEDATGLVRTYDVNGKIDLDNPFFQDLGTNGRTCASCHQPSTAWTITPANVQARFNDTRGRDPIFTNNDGSICEGATFRSLDEERAAYGMLLNRGLIRVGLDVPQGAEFVIDSVKDPNHCGPASNDTSLYRRPLPATNLDFLSAVMWDGRESTATTTILQDLAQQANDATTGHAQATHGLTPMQTQQIVAFETGLYTAQVRDHVAGGLHADGANGGPVALAREPFFIGINDPVGLNPKGTTFDASAFDLFDAWAQTSRGRDPQTLARQSIARGEALFNTKPITISGVAGLNGATFASGITMPASFSGTCTVCHDSPNIGDHSVKAPLNIGLTDPSVAPYLPVYTLRNLTTQQTVQTTDPGRAMITGKWADVGKFKGPILRALAARAPYFHNGSAATLSDVVDFYDTRFNIGLTVQEKADLIAFLRSL